MTVLIVEDEAVAARQLKAMLGRAGADIKVVNVLESIDATVAYLRESPRPDLILLDIELSDGQSFEIFSQVDITSPVIFTTAYDEYARRAFEVNSVDYLLKPVEETALRRALDKFRNLRQAYSSHSLDQSPGADPPTLLLPVQELLRYLSDQQQQGYAPPIRNRFLVQQGQRLLPIDIEEVAYFFTTNKLTYLKTHSDKQYMLDYSLDDLERSLDPRRFYRANRQFIVNHKAVHKIHLYFTSKLKVELNPVPVEEVIISREKAMSFRRWLGE